MSAKWERKRAREGEIACRMKGGEHKDSIRGGLIFGALGVEVTHLRTGE